MNRERKGNEKALPEGCALSIRKLRRLLRGLLGFDGLFHTHLLSGPGDGLLLLCALGKLLETFHAAGGVHVLLLAGVERMTLGADFDVDRLDGRSGRILLAAGARDDGVFVVGRVNSLFHTSLALDAPSKSYGKRLSFERGASYHASSKLTRRTASGILRSTVSPIPAGREPFMFSGISGCSCSAPSRGEVGRKTGDASLRGPSACRKRSGQASEADDRG